MSKATNRNKLVENLRNTIEADELHIISTLANVSLSVRCEHPLNEVFETDTGAPQGDRASALDLPTTLLKP